MNAVRCVDVRGGDRLADTEAEDVGESRRVAGPGTVADGADAHCGLRPEVRIECAEQRSA